MLLASETRRGAVRVPGVPARPTSRPPRALADVRTVDYSRTGMRIEGAADVPAAPDVEVALELADGQEVHARGEVLRVDEESGEAVVRFVELEEGAPRPSSAASSPNWPGRTRAERGPRAHTAPPDPFGPGVLRVRGGRAPAGDGPQPPRLGSAAAGRRAAARRRRRAAGRRGRGVLARRRGRCRRRARAHPRRWGAHPHREPAASGAPAGGAGGSEHPGPGRAASGHRPAGRAGWACPPRPGWR